MPGGFCEPISILPTTITGLGVGPTLSLIFVRLTGPHKISLGLSS